MLVICIHVFHNKFLTFNSLRYCAGWTVSKSLSVASFGFTIVWSCTSLASVETTKIQIVLFKNCIWVKTNLIKTSACNLSTAFLHRMWECIGQITRANFNLNGSKQRYQRNYTSLNLKRWAVWYLILTIIIMHIHYF